MRLSITLLGVAALIMAGSAARGDDYRYGNPYRYYRSPGAYGQRPSPDYAYGSQYYRHGYTYRYPYQYDRRLDYRGYDYRGHGNYSSPYYYYRSPSYYGGYSSWGYPYSSYSSPFRGYSFYFRW